MNIDYYNEKQECLCFRHAVKAAIESNESITTSIDDSDPGESGWFSFCVECSKED